MNNDRTMALRIINDWKSASKSELTKAIFDLRHNALAGDEVHLLPLLQSDYCTVVFSALSALCYVYDQYFALEPLIYKFAQGDPRDSMEMPIQCTALDLIADHFQNDDKAVVHLLNVVKNALCDPVPRMVAVFRVAKFFKLPIEDTFRESLVLYPDSDESQKLYSRITQFADELILKK